MTRGFTFFELIITIIVLTILLMSAAPSFSLFFQGQNIKRFASDLTGFFIQVKSQSVLKNKLLKVFFFKQENDWIISLQHNDRIFFDIEDIKSTSISYLSSHDYPQISITSSIKMLNFNPVRSTPHMPASFLFYSHQERKLKLSIHNITGRIKICGQIGSYYGYDKC